jgi:two-component system cell cycle sensor histidine kinase/response regulator CckA
MYSDGKVLVCLRGGIAHDFNNLLTAMLGNVSLALSRMPDDHPAVKNIERTKTAVERAATLTKQMLAYSGKGRFQILSIDLVKIVQDHLGFFEASLPKNVSIDTHLSPMPVIVKGDPGQIEQIVMNLIINAGEAIGNNNGTVDISVLVMNMSDEAVKPFGRLNGQTLTSGMYAFFQVTDTGVGMSSETLEKIFDPFFTTKFVGRGLGLSAVLGIIRSHNGGITVNSTENSGTIFQVILPLEKSDAIDKQSTGDRFEPNNVSPTILVIDDEDYIIDMTNDILDGVGYKHYSAADPEKAIKLFIEHWRSIELVILDFSMPKMNGKEVLLELRNIKPDIKVIMSSGYSEEELHLLMGDVEPSAIIQKPHHPQNLIALIKNVLSHS